MQEQKLLYSDGICVNLLTNIHIHQSYGQFMVSDDFT